MIEHRQQVEEIRKLIEYPDRKSSQLFAQCFSGIRLDAGCLQWKHVIPLTEGNGKKFVSAKFRVCAGDIRILHFHYV
jgi:hypothetical protein